MGVDPYNKFTAGDGVDRVPDPQDTQLGVQRFHVRCQGVVADLGSSPCDAYHRDVARHARVHKVDGAQLGHGFRVPCQTVSSRGRGQEVNSCRQRPVRAGVVRHRPTSFATMTTSVPRAGYHRRVAMVRVSAVHKATANWAERGVWERLTGLLSTKHEPYKNKYSTNRTKQTVDEGNLNRCSCLDS